MTKFEFLSLLREELAGLPEDEINSRLSFYEESINDRMDEGKSEEEAVAELGYVSDIVSQIAKDTPFFTIVKDKVKPKRRLSTLEIVLISVTFPIWLPLLITILALIPVFYLVFWIIGLIPSITCVSSYLFGLAGIFTFFVAIFSKNANAFELGLGIAGLGIGTMLIPASIYSIKGMIKLTALIILKIKTAIMFGRSK